MPLSQGISPGHESLHHAQSLLLGFKSMASQSLCQMDIDLSIGHKQIAGKSAQHKQTRDVTYDATAQFCNLQAGNLKAASLRVPQSPVGSGTQGKCGSVHFSLSYPAVGRGLTALQGIDIYSSSHTASFLC